MPRRFLTPTGELIEETTPTAGNKRQFAPPTSYFEGRKVEQGAWVQDLATPASESTPNATPNALSPQQAQALEDEKAALVKQLSSGAQQGDRVKVRSRIAAIEARLAAGRDSAETTRRNAERGAERQRETGAGGGTTNNAHSTAASVGHARLKNGEWHVTDSHGVENSLSEAYVEQAIGPKVPGWADLDNRARAPHVARVFAELEGGNAPAPTRGTDPFKRFVENVQCADPAAFQAAVTNTLARGGSVRAELAKLLD